MVHEIGGGDDFAEAARPQAVKGAWKVDERGEIVGALVSTPKHDAAFRKPD